MAISIRCHRQTAPRCISTSTMGMFPDYACTLGRMGDHRKTSLIHWSFARPYISLQNIACSRLRCSSLPCFCPSIWIFREVLCWRIWWLEWVRAGLIAPLTILNTPYHSDDNRAKFAVQSLLLSSGGLEIPWQNQLDRLNMASTFASRFLKIPLSKLQFTQKLYLQRSVFTKVSLPTRS